MEDVTIIIQDSTKPHLRKFSFNLQNPSYLEILNWSLN